MKGIILYTKTGNGHMSAGKAVAASLNNLGVSTEEFDSLDLAGKLISKEICSSYNNMVKISPKLFGVVYDVGEKINKTNRKSIIYRLNSLYGNRLLEIIHKEKPDIVLCTHIFSAQTLNALKEKGKISCITAAVITDYTYVPFWNETSLDYYFLPHKDLVNDYIAKGMDKYKLIPFGLPVNPKFKINISKTLAKKALNYDIDKPHILIMGGSMGAGHLLDNTKAISESFKDARITAICGNNEKLFKKMEDANLSDNVDLLHFTNKMDKLMDSADILVTKPGGLTSTEAMDKGIPMVMINPIPGVESANCNFFELHNTALYSHSPDETVAYCKKLLDDKAFYEKIVNSQKNVANSNAADNIAAFLVDKVKEKK